MGQKVASRSSERTFIFSDLLTWFVPLKRKPSHETHFKETRPRFTRSALVKAAIPLLLMELLCSLVEGKEKKSQFLFFTQGQHIAGIVLRLCCILTAMWAECGWLSGPQPKPRFLCPPAGYCKDWWQEFKNGRISKTSTSSTANCDYSASICTLKILFSNI